MSNEINNLPLKENENVIPEPIIKKFDIDKRDIIYIFLLMLSSILISAFGIFSGFNGGFAVTSIILTTVLSFYLLNKQYKFKFFSILCLFLNFCINLSFIFTSNGSVRFWSFVLCNILNFIWFVSIIREQKYKGDSGYFNHIVSPLLEAIANLPTVFISLFNKTKRGSKTAGRVFIGIIASVPVLLTVIPLLMSSDQAFSGMVTIVFEQTATIILRSILGIIIGIFVISYALSLKKDQPLLKDDINIVRISPTIIISFLCALSVCYLSYLFSQLAYFFNAFSGFLPEGYKFTYSAYARRGFFEMSIIAIINFAIIFLCRLLSNKENKKPLVAINILSSFISVFTLIIITTALSKMFLYIKIYGMTKLRITTSFFMVFLGVVFIALIIRLYWPKISIIKTSVITACVILILLGTFNVNNIVADYNYNAYTKGTLKKIDIETIYELGDEGIPYLILLTDDDNYNVSNMAKYKLSLAYDNYYNIKYDEFDNPKTIKKIYSEIGQLNIPRQKAYEELEKYLKKDRYILKYKDYYINTINPDNITY